MGIRFYCPNGHKLNVKAYLAGRRGICPDCGASFDIPLESTRESSRESRTMPPPDEPIPTPVTAPRPAEQFAIAPQVTEVPDSNELIDSNSEFIDKTPPEPESVVHPAENSDSPAANPDSFLAETETLWYIQAPGGGPQYGPATDPVVQSWIAERRIGPKMLVWREGWSSWLEARNVFPELQAMFSGAIKSPQSDHVAQSAHLDRSEVDEEEELATVEPNSGVRPTAKLTTRLEKQKRASQKLALVVILSVAILALGGLLIFLLNRP